MLVKAKTKDLGIRTTHDVNYTSVIVRSRYIIKIEEKDGKILPA